jgi:hypothetical protein
LACNAVARTTARRTEEQQRTALFIFRQRTPLAAREPIDRCVGEGQDESLRTIGMASSFNEERLPR